jgi:hypothetical protein
MTGQKAVASYSLVPTDVVPIFGSPFIPENVPIRNHAENKYGALSIADSAIFFAGKTARRCNPRVALAIATKRNHPLRPGTDAFQLFGQRKFSKMESDAGIDIMRWSLPSVGVIHHVDATRKAEVSKFCLGNVNVGTQLTLGCLVCASYEPPCCPKKGHGSEKKQPLAIFDSEYFAVNVILGWQV